ncbi:unnamed protein product, partial [Discosporangium mesarthrocarpum]
DELEEIEADLGRKIRLWRSMETFEERLGIWASTPFIKIDMAEMEAEVQRYWRTVQLSEKHLPTNPAVGRLKKMVKEVKLTVPVVADLRSECLTARHWAALQDVLGTDVRGNPSLTFQEMVEANLKNAADAVSSVVTEAEQEAILLRMVDKVHGMWAEAEFELKVFKGTRGVFILGGVDEITSHLDDSIVTVGNVLASPYVGPIRADVEDLASKLHTLQVSLNLMGGG